MDTVAGLGILWAVFLRRRVLAVCALTALAAQAATGVDSGAAPAPKRESRVVASNLPALSPSLAANLAAQAASVGPRAASTASRLKSPEFVTRVPTPDDPLRVMILGDSVTYEIAPPLEWALESSGVARVEDRTQVGLGLSRWPIFHWWEVWQPFIEEIHPEVVVVQMGIWDASSSDSLFAGSRWPVPETGDWEQNYGFLLDVFMNLVTQEGAHVYWVSMLPSQQPGLTGRLNGALESLAARDPRATLIDLTERFTDANGYLQAIEIDGRTWPLRKPDGVHVCRDGAALAADGVADQLAGDWGVVPAEDWTTGPWVTHPRYEVNPCAPPS